MLRTNRLHYIDIAKGILILLVLISHFGIAMKWAGVNDENPNFLVLYFFQPIFTSFFMQCFLMISGFCSNFEVEPKIFFYKQTRQLIIPWLFFESLRMIFYAVQGNFVSAFSVFNNGQFSTLWFLNALIFSKTITYLFHRYNFSNKLILIIAFIFLFVGIILHDYNIQFLCIWQSFIAVFFVALGYTIKKINRNILNHIETYSLILYSIIIIIRFLFKVQLPVQDNNTNITIVTIPFFIITSLSGSFAFIYLCKKIKSNKLFEFYGRNSLIVYGIHMYPFMALISFLQNIFSLYNIYGAVLFLLISYIAEIIVMWCLIKILNLKYIKFMIGK